MVVGGLPSGEGAGSFAESEIGQPVFFEKQ